jgi:hypothetical protein
MENPQMGMPAEMAPQGPSPEETAIYEQMRQEISPQEFSNEMLAGASQVDPQAVAEFTQELQGLDMPPEVLDALNDVVDEILASPERYQELRATYMDQGLPEDILPEQFDPQFFAALNMAIDQMIAAPTGVQAFAKGGIAELKPIAKAIASYGRNGDTMLAHITPAEARMLRRRGGSGTTNPDTGLPEFFLKKLFKGVGKALKSVGKAVKKFANSTVGRLVATVALGFFLGPAAASLMGVTSVAGVAAVSGFVGSAGSTLLGGGNLKDALKAGAIGGLTAGAGAGIMGGADAFAAGSSSTAGMTAGQALSNQVDKFTGAFTPGAAAQAPVPEVGSPAPGLGPNQMPVPDSAPYSELKMTGTPVKPFPEFFGDQGSLPPAGSSAYDLNMQAQNAARVGASSPAPGSGYTQALADTPARMPGGTGTAPAYKPGGPTIGESFSKMGEGLGMGDTPASFKTFTEGASDLFSPGPTNAQVTSRAYEIMSSTGGTLKDAMAVASKELAPGFLRTYGPAAVAGIGAMSAFGGFESKPVQGGAITQSLMTPVTKRIADEGTQRQMYLQGMPGVVYDQFGAPIYGQSTRLPTYDVPDYDSGGFRNYGMGNQGGMDMPAMYNTPAGSIGSRRVAQPYNNSDMYSNLVPRQYAYGGDVQSFAEGGVAETTDIFKRVLGRDPTTAEFAKWQPIFSGGMDVRKWVGFTEDPTIATEQKDYNTRLGEARSATEAAQKAARDKVAQDKAMRKAAGSGQMYNNINAGIAALAPEINPMDDKDTGFGARNRQAKLDVLNHAYAPMLQGQKNAMNQQAGIAASGQLPTDISGYSGQDKAGLYRGLARQGLTDAQIRAGAENRYGMQSDADWQELQRTVGDPNRNTARPVAAQPAAMPSYTNAGRQPAGGMYSNITNAPAAYTGPNLYSQALSIGLMPTGADKMAGYQRLLQQGATDAQIRNAGETIYGPQSNMNWDALRGGIPEQRPPMFATQPPGMGSVDPFYQQRMGLDAQVTARNSQGQNATPAQLAEMRRLSELSENDPGVNARRDAINEEALRRGTSTTFMNMGGIAGLAQGGYPRRTGQISGPGTEKSDSIPAMLSDGEFVMTAKAVRGAGKGNRRAGAKQMYKLMHQLEKNSERG